MNMTHAFIAALSEARDLHPAPEPVGNPRAMALAFRIKAHCDAVEWNCTTADCAAALGINIWTARNICRANGWTGRLRGYLQVDRSVGYAVPMTVLHEVSEVPRAGWVAE